MKIGILTYHKANNYGAYMQAYALTMKFKSLGFDVEIIDFNMLVAEKQYIVKNKNPIKRYYEVKRHNTFAKALKDLPLSKDTLISDSIDDFVGFVKNKYDVIIAGSDEIWKLDSFRGFPNPYWLIGDLGAKKFSYAASSRSDFSVLSVNDKNIVKNALADFKIIGVRDEYTYQELKDLLDSYTGEKLCLYCDPTFLYDFRSSRERGKLILKRRIDPSKKTVVFMSDDNSLAESLRSELHGKVNLVAVYRRQSGYKNFIDLTPFQWADVIAAADVLVTKYFHGVCFALKNNTRFVAIDSREKVIKSGKIYDLIHREGLLNYFLSTQEDEYRDKAIKIVNQLLKTMEPIDFSKNVQHQCMLSEHFFTNLNKEIGVKVY